MFPEDAKAIMRDAREHDVIAEEDQRAVLPYLNAVLRDASLYEAALCTVLDGARTYKPVSAGTAVFAGTGGGSREPTAAGEHFSEGSPQVSQTCTRNSASRD